MMGGILSYCIYTVVMRQNASSSQNFSNISANRCYFRIGPRVLLNMGLVITPLQTPRRFNPLAQPLGTPQKLGGRELVCRFDGGDITSDGGALVLRQLEQRTGIVRRFATCFED